jgi:transposase
LSCTTADRRARPTALHPNFLDAPITRWLTADPAALSLEDYAFTEALCMAAPKLREAPENIRAFADPMRQSDPAGLTPRLEAAATIDLGGFVAGLRQDEAAIRANIVEPWSNGLVEGQVNRAGRVPEWRGYW